MVKDKLFRSSSGIALALLFLPLTLRSQTNRAVEQFGDISQMPDRSEDFQRQIASQNGNLTLEPGVHRITKTLTLSLDQQRSTIVSAKNGAVTLIMDGPGPALRIEGSHQGTASPKSFQKTTWNERMPLVTDLEIVGNHPEADGIHLFQCFEPIISRVAVRWCRHGIRLVTRNRNVTISDCHLYENSGVGIFYDSVNLHQSNIANCHISYNREGGIVIRDGNVRNVQIANCDIEGNMPADDSPTQAANILIDLSATPEDKSHSVAEIAITGCTIQHSSNYSGKEFSTIAPGGANIRLLGKALSPIDSVTISGNVISDTSLNVEIVHCADLTLTGNTFFAPNPDNLVVRESQRIIVNGNTFHPREFSRPGRVIFSNCRDCILSNCVFHALQAEDGAVQILQCERINLLGNLMTECKSGVVIKDSKTIQLQGWIVSGLPENSSFITQKGICEDIRTD